MSLPAHWPNTNKTYKSTAINNSIAQKIAIKRTQSPPDSSPVPSPNWGGLGWGLCLASILLLLTSCAPIQSVRPIVKIGLIAPFEGLYRASGYAALEGMRQAMTACAPAGIDVLPLALDDSGDSVQARRAAQKLLVDPTVRAIVGPLLLDAIPAVSDVMSSTPTSTSTSGPTIAWYIPPLVMSDGNFATPSSSAWLAAQVEHIAASTTATRVLLMGLPTTWQLPMETALPTLRIDDLATALATVGEDDALLWLGRPEVGAEWHAAISATHPNVEFWLATQAGIDIFAAQAEDLQTVRWLIWTNSNYNQRLQPDDAAGEETTGAMHELTYQATCEALRMLGDEYPPANLPDTR